MYLPPSENLAINTLSGIFSDMSESYKIFWFNGILDGISEGKSVQLFDDIVNRMIVDAWYMVTEYHLNLGPSDALEKLSHTLQADCGLPSNAKGKDILAADPMMGTTTRIRIFAPISSALRTERDWS